MSLIWGNKLKLSIFGESHGNAIFIMKWSLWNCVLLKEESERL